MSKLAVIYWSGTGNTEMMAQAIADGAKGTGCQVHLTEVETITADEAASYDAIALGCPAMGAEELEDSIFEPFYSELKANLKDKIIALFGSYDWGDGEWMRQWEEDARSAGAILCHNEGLIVNNAPEAEDLDECNILGKDLSAMII